MLIASIPVLDEDVITPHHSRFILGPLEPGFGYTLGNTLRRTLLSSIPGAAITSVRIDGVLHEFTTIAGVREDVTEILLNMKEIVVASSVDEPVTAVIRKEGPAILTAGDIAAPAGVEVMNPDLVLATLAAGATFAAELVIERGRGYVPAVQNKRPDSPIGEIAVDAIYSPVRSVTYSVEDTRVEQRTDFDRLVVDVETKPSTNPREALASAGATLVNLFSLVRTLSPEAEGIDLPQEVEEVEQDEALSASVETLDLPVRALNSLKRAGILTLGDLITQSEPDLSDLQGMGEKSVQEVKDRLESMGLTLAG